MKLQVAKTGGEAAGNLTAFCVSPLLLEAVNIQFPFLAAGAVALLSVLHYTAYFCIRDGFGKPLADAEGRRIAKFGIARTAAWAEFRGP